MRNLIHPVCRCGMLAVLARLAGPAVVGQFALGIAVSAPLVALARFRRQEPGAADIRITSLSLALLGIAAVGFLDHTLQDRLAVLLVVAAEMVDWIAEIYAGHRGALSAVLHGVLPIVALVLAFARTRHLGFALVAVVVVKLLVLFGYDFRQPRRQRIDYGWGIAELTATVPWYFVAHVLGLAALGMFAAIQSFLFMAEAVARRLTGAGLMLAIAGPWICGAVFGPEYGRHPALVVALAAAASASLVDVMLSETLASSRRFPLEVLSIAGMSLACVGLAPKLGLLGAACAVAFGVAIRIGGAALLARTADFSLCLARSPAAAGDESVLPHKINQLLSRDQRERS